MPQISCFSLFPAPYLLDGFQHGPASVPRLGGLPDAVQTRHAVPLPVLQLPVEGVGEHQNAVIQVEVGHLGRRYLFKVLIYT